MKQIQTVGYLEFLLRYSRRGKVVYGFVEGKEDPCFYRSFISLALPSDWRIEIWPAGNRDRVFFIHKLIDWRRFSKRRVCFFVDRDLSDLIPEKLNSDTNIYVTPGYSIENDVVCGEVFTRILTELCGFSGADHKELDKVESLFEDQLDTFRKKLIPVMAWAVSWRRNGKRPTLSDIMMRDIFSISGGKVAENPMPKGKSDVIEYIHAQCNIRRDLATDISPIVTQLTVKEAYKAMTRGKYVFWFLIEFCNSVHRDSALLFPRFGRKPKMIVALSTSNGMALVGPRARLPKQLKLFLDANYAAYIGLVSPSSPTTE